MVEGNLVDRLEDLKSALRGYNDNISILKELINTELYSLDREPNWERIKTCTKHVREMTTAKQAIIKEIFDINVELNERNSYLTFVN